MTINDDVRLLGCLSPCGLVVDWSSEKIQSWINKGVMSILLVQVVLLCTVNV